MHMSVVFLMNYLQRKDMVSITSLVAAGGVKWFF